MKLKMSVRNANANNLLAALDAAATPGYVNCYTSPIPATLETAITTQTLLAVLALGDPSGTVTDGVLTFNVITEDSSANNDGVCTWARFFDGDNNAVGDFTIGLVASGADLIFNDVDFVQDGPVRLNSIVITF